MKKRLTIFAKGNVDLHDSLHSCVIAGELRWNGINEVVRRSHPGTLARLKHETWTRSDALLQADGVVPPELAERSLSLGSYPLASQFSTALFNTDADVFVLSIMPDAATCLLKHRRSGFLFYPGETAGWNAEDRNWLKTDFESSPLMDVTSSLANLERIVDRIRSRSDAPILVYNLSPIVPGPIVHTLQGLGETFATRIRRFNLALADLSETTGISIIDVDEILARAGADRLKVDAMHLAPEAYRLIAEEVLRVMEDLGVFEFAHTPDYALA
ncbi:MAG TPA: SGNH/GDSL hydrolase family protein [Acidisoma sp.]|uniref:SGNH/GDSL hydrolase family protein n=1 Tax=Acidisoma sp. TaxID=1872115 RepID=UPI002BE3BD54|nr:SGNH/GDSL hydrolase family protein [Acidisoma sp.]HTI01916.1 SGNH/GDSL hydrolase family protein [Acidisoma sp.]